MRANSTLPLSLIVLLGLMGYLGYQLYTIKIPCVTTLTYSLESYDTRFGLPQATINADIKKATEVWNAALGKTVFAPAKTSPDLPVDFVYGSLQSEIDTAQSLNTNIDASQSQLTQIANQFADLKAQYEQAARQGKATQEMYQELQTLLARYYELRAAINRDVSKGNSLPQGESEAGEYVSDQNGTNIYIFGFGSEQELESTLIHEFGHALGLGHVSDPKAVMYPTDVSTSVVLDAADLAEMHRACGEAQSRPAAKLYIALKPAFDFLAPYIERAKQFVASQTGSQK